MWLAGASVPRAALIAVGWALVTVTSGRALRRRVGRPKIATIAVIVLVHASGVALAILLSVVWPWIRGADWGTATDRVVSQDGRYEVVTYEFTAVIDPGWNLAIERVDSGDREWFWRSVEGPAPTEVRFVGANRVEVVDSSGEVYAIEFDAESLEPTDRYCLSPGYCYERPWDQYTASTP